VPHGENNNKGRKRQKRERVALTIGTQKTVEETLGKNCLSGITHE